VVSSLARVTVRQECAPYPKAASVRSAKVGEALSSRSVVSNEATTAVNDPGKKLRRSTQPTMNEVVTHRVGDLHLTATKGKE